MSILPIDSLRSTPPASWQPLTGPIIIGRDVLELLSSSMYVDPMAIYREYVQNAADAIDDARKAGLLGGEANGRVTIDIDATARSIKIRDNGVGVPSAEFEQRLVAFGGSQKRGQGQRGFRGVGRLAGLGYCQELTFRTRAAGEKVVAELSWNCRKLKSAVRGSESNGLLEDLVRTAASVRSGPAFDEPAHFFEVELKGLVRHRNDQLLNPEAVAFYLAQVAPVPFSETFRFGTDIRAALRTDITLGTLDIYVTGIEGPLRRPHSDEFAVRQREADRFQTIDQIVVKGLDGGTAALGWIAHHGYTGAIPAAAGFKGLRVRCGDLQIGDDRLFEEIFLEPRFNAWTVGEIHVIDARIIPNGRRDHFEQNGHFQNLLSQLAPVGREISKRCRASSIQRNRTRDLFLQLDRASDNLAVVRQNAIKKTERQRLIVEVGNSIPVLEKRALTLAMSEEQRQLAKRKLTTLKRLVSRTKGAMGKESRLSVLPAAEQRTVEKVLALIYECAPNRTAARLLVDRLLTRLPRLPGMRSSEIPGD